MYSSGLNVKIISESGTIELLNNIGHPTIYLFCKVLKGLNLLFYEKEGRKAVVEQEKKYTNGIVNRFRDI